MVISIHKPITTKPRNTVDFSFFLAGLIDSDGHFSKIPELVVSFGENEIHTSYYLKKELGYGIVSRVKNKKAVKFVMAHSLGLLKVSSLVHNKLQHIDKITQYNTRLCFLKGFCLTVKQDPFPIKQNAWFSGFFMGDGCFQIKIIQRTNRKNAEVCVVIQIDQKTKVLLSQIKDAFGGRVSYRKSQDTFYYSSVSFGVAETIIKYFDQFHLMGIKMTQYTLWRKVFLKIQKHNFKRTALDYKWISKVKERMSLLGSSSID